MKTLSICFLALCYSVGILCAQPSDDFYKGLKETKAPASFQVQDFVKQAAKNFGSKRVKNFGGEMLHYRTVLQDGKYCEFNGYMGIFGELDFHQKPETTLTPGHDLHYYVVPKTVMISHPFGLGTDVLEAVMSHTPGLKALKDKTSTNYNNFAMSTEVFYKARHLEVYAPLNMAYADCYTYDIKGFYTDGQGVQWAAIAFQTQPESFPSKTRLFGKGIILYNVNTKTPSKVYMENHIDLSDYPPNYSPTPVHTATKHQLELCYSYVNGSIYPASIALAVNWIDPLAPESEKVYEFITNARVRPFRYRLETRERLEFSHPVVLSKSQIEQWKKMVAHVSRLWYAAPYMADIWKAVELIGIDRATLEKDLNRTGESLAVQAEKNALRWHEWYATTRDKASIVMSNEAKSIETAKQYHKNFPAAYELLYKQ